MTNPSMKYDRRFKVLSTLGLLLIWSEIGMKTASTETWIARGIVHECVKPIPDFSMSVTYDLFCAMKAKSFDSVIFSYESESDICGLYLERKNTSTRASEFNRVISLDLLEDSAFGKATYGTTNYVPFIPPNAVDGDESTFYSAFGGINSPFWLVDLGSVKKVHVVMMLPANNDWEYIELRLGMALETTGDFSSYTLFATFTGPYSGAQDYLHCYSLGVLGRYLSIQKNPPATDYLSFTEVKVYTSIP